MDAGNRVVITTTEPVETNFALMSVSYALNWCRRKEVLLRPPASTQHPADQTRSPARLDRRVDGRKGRDERDGKDHRLLTAGLSACGDPSSTHASVCIPLRKSQKRRLASEHAGSVTTPSARTRPRAA